MRPRRGAFAGHQTLIISVLILGCLVGAALALAHLTSRSSSPGPASLPSATTSPSGTKPGPSNTGVPAGTRLTAVSGGMEITKDDAVVDAKEIEGPVIIDAKRVTIRNSTIHGDGQDYGVLVRSGSVHIWDSEMWGFQNGIAFSNWSATRVDLHEMTDDGVKLGSNTTLADSWIHDMTPSADAHADGGQMQAGSTHVTVAHNTIDMASRGQLGNSALMISPDLGPSSAGPVSIADNWLNGGNYTLYCVDGNNGQYFVKNISILSNRFGPDMNYGPVQVTVPVTARGNVFDKTGAPVQGLASD